MFVVGHPNLRGWFGNSVGGFTSCKDIHGLYQGIFECDVFFFGFSSRLGVANTGHVVLVYFGGKAGFGICFDLCYFDFGTVHIPCSLRSACPRSLHKLHQYLLISCR